MREPSYVHLIKDCGDKAIARVNSSLLVVLIVIVLVVGSTLSIMNKACKSGYHAWCAPMSTVWHRVKTRPPAQSSHSETDKLVVALTGQGRPSGRGRARLVGWRASVWPTKIAR